MLDQRLALEWIQKNIAIFGGNPKNVTLFGQSDGATGAGLHMASYGGKGNVPFKRVIFQSGGPAGDPGVSGNGTITSATTVARLAGCTGNNSKTVLSCLRKLPHPKLLAAVIEYENITATRGSYQDIFYPTLDNDYIPAAPSTLLRTGRFHRNISSVLYYLNKAYPHLNISTIHTLTETLYPISSFRATAQAIEAPSPHVLQAAQIYRDINFACPAIDIVHRVTEYSPHTPTYLYDFNTTSYGLLLQLANATWMGSIHTSEVLFAFDNADYGGFLPITPAQNVTQKRVSGSWARFGATGNPSGSEDANLSLKGWTPALRPRQVLFKDSVVDNVSVRIVGGENAGQRVLRMEDEDGDGGRDGISERGVLRRCAFINSADVQAQVQT